jgi:hypothetical protein
MNEGTGIYDEGRSRPRYRRKSYAKSDLEV